MFRRWIVTELRIAFQSSWWLVLIAISLLLSYLNIGQIYWGAKNNSVVANLWDVQFVTFGNKFVLFFCTGMVFIFLVGLVLAHPENDELTIFRLRSRQTWLFGKILFVGVIAFCCNLLLCLALLIATITTFRWEVGWSQYAQQFPSNVYLHPATMLFLSPLTALTHTVLLESLGFWVIGNIILLVTVTFQNQRWGFISGVLTLLLTYLSWPAEITGKFSWLLPYHHFFLWSHSNDATNLDYPPLWFSYLYWGILLLVIAMAGVKLINTADIGRGR